MTERKPNKRNKRFKDTIAEIIRRTMGNAEQLEDNHGARSFTHSSTSSVLRNLPNNSAPAHLAYSESGTTSGQSAPTEPFEAASLTISTAQTASPSNVEGSASSTISAIQIASPSNVESLVSLTISTAQTGSPSNVEGSASSTISTIQIGSPSNAKYSALLTISTAQTGSPSNVEGSGSSSISTVQIASPSNAESSASLIISAAEIASLSNVGGSASSSISIVQIASPSNAESSASSTISTAQTASPSNAEVSAMSTYPAPPELETFYPPKIYRELSPPPGLPPRRLGKSHRIEAPPLSSRRRKYHECGPLSLPVPRFSESELELFVAMEILQDNAEAQNQLNESVADWLQCMEFPEGIPESPPPHYISNVENVKKLESKEASKLEKEKECIICKRFERLSLQKEEVHLSWLHCKFYITSHMHNICAWDAGPEKPKSEFWLDSEHQRCRQIFDQQVKSSLNELDMLSLSTAVNTYLESFKQLLYNHTPLDQVYLQEKCEEQLVELQTEFLMLLTMRVDILKYLLNQEEGFRHDQCPSYGTSMEWIKECTNEISQGLREFEINMENLHLGRLIWSDKEG